MLKKKLIKSNIKLFFNNKKEKKIIIEKKCK